MAAPTAVIVVAETALGIGETSTVTITFSEAVTGFSIADLTVANGTLSALSTSDNITYTATLTPAAGITDATNRITLDNTGVVNGAGDAGVGTTDSNNYALDATRATATIVLSDTTLRAGETSLVTITFSEAVTGFDNADLTVANGALTAVSSSDGGITWTATLTPTAGIADASNLIILGATGVADLAGNTGTGTTNSINYAIDTIRPTATIVVADTALAAGETSGVTVTFSEAVSGFDNADLTVANGALTAMSSSDGGITWTATLTPTAAIADATNRITLDNTGVVNAAGNAGAGATDSNNYAIDTARPTAAIVVAETALGIGETTQVTITFSEAVTGLTIADLTADNATLSALSTSDNITYTATLTPTAAINDATNRISLDNTGVVDAAGNAGAGTTDSNNYALDAVRPTATITVADTTLGVGETSLVTITFSEAVTGFDNADLTVANAALSAVSSSDGGITWTATLTPTAAISDATNLITLGATGVADLAGNTGTGTTDSNNYAIDTVLPAPPPLPVNLNGTAFADVIFSNDLDNVIAAGAGHDTVFGGLGSDSIAGDDDRDFLQGNSGDDRVLGGTGADVVLGGQGDDHVQGNAGADYVSGDKGADTVHGGQGDDTVQGGESDDYVSGDRGNDIVRGGRGDDQVLGGDGDDFVSGDQGADTITGGLGADLFHTFGAAGLDYVVDFNQAEGDRVMLDSGTLYTLAQVGADTVITMDGGGQMILAGVQLSTLNANWIFTG